MVYEPHIVYSSGSVNSDALFSLSTQYVDSSRGGSQRSGSSQFISRAGTP